MFEPRSPRASGFESLDGKYGYHLHLRWATHSPALHTITCAYGGLSFAVQPNSFSLDSLGFFVKIANSSTRTRDSILDLFSTIAAHY